jgi:hypothetical protein
MDVVDDSLFWTIPDWTLASPLAIALGMNGKVTHIEGPKGVALLSP